MSFVLAFLSGLALGEDKELLRQPVVGVLIALFVAFKAVDELASAAKNDDEWFDKALDSVTRGPKTLVVVVALGYGFGATVLDDPKPLYAFLVVACSLLVASAFRAARFPSDQPPGDAG